MNCKHCGKELKPNGAKMHEKFCKQNPEVIDKDARSANDVTHVLKEFITSSEVSQSQSDHGATFLEKSTTPTKPQIPNAPDDIYSEKNKEYKKTKLYFILVAIFVFAGALQYFLFSWLQMHWIFVAVAWFINILILVFLIWTVWRLRKLQEPVIFEDIEEFVKQVPKWAINEKSPKSGLVGGILNKGKDYKQLVFVSENFEPKAVWAEWDGFMFRIGNRGYIPPRDVRGDIFPYHVDKKECLIDTAKATKEDAEDSYQLLAVWNQAFSVGHAAALNETQQQVKMILIIVAVILIAVIGLAIYQYGQFEAINTKFALAEKLINQIAAEGVKTKP